METENIYNNSRIYKIVDLQYTKAYYGSTTQSLSKRMSKHRDKYRCGKLQCTSKLLFDEFGIDNCKIELVEKVECNDIDELRKIEGEYIKKNECVNKNIAGRSKEEYNEYYKISGQRTACNKKYREIQGENLLKKKRDYYRENAEIINLKKSKYYLCECGIYSTHGHKSSHILTSKHLKLINLKTKSIEI